MNPVIVCYGDEDRAQAHYADAYALYQSGSPGVQLSDGTIIDIVRAGGVPIAYINSPFLCEYAVLAPRQTEVGYQLDVYGYYHRKDAMIPQGKQIISVSYAGNGFPYFIGPEILYITDGIALKLTSCIAQSTYSRRTPVNYILSMSLMSPVEDLQTDSNGTATVQGFMAFEGGIPLKVSWALQGDNLYSACPYGVDRTGAFPVYRAVVGSHYEDAGTLITQYYNSGNSSVQYSMVYPILAYISAGKGATPDGGGNTFNSDIMVPNVSNVESAPYPIVIPLGNNRVFILSRKWTANSSLIYGGSFSLAAYVVSGAGYSFSAASTAGITTNYYVGTSWNFGPTSGAAIVTPYDNARNWGLFDAMAESARVCLPLSNDETLIDGYRVGISAAWGKADTTYNAQLVCFSVTSTGIAQKSVVFSFWDQFVSPGNHSIYTSNMPRHMPAVLGFCKIGSGNEAGKIYLYYTMQYAPDFNTDLAWDGVKRFVSSDDGATWSAMEAVTLNLTTEADPTEPAAFMLSPPKWVGSNADGDPIIVCGYIRADTVGSDVALTKASIVSSVGGLIFDVGNSGTADLGYILDPNGWLMHTQTGLGSLQHFGNHEDGYAPSPHRHLPNYYGTPTKICRDSSGDPNL